MPPIDMPGTSRFDDPLVLDSSRASHLACIDLRIDRGGCSMHPNTFACFFSPLD